jgi:hypothetical protein
VRGLGGGLLVYEEAGKQREDDHEYWSEDEP